MVKLDLAAWLAQREAEQTRRRLLPLDRLPDGRLRLLRDGAPPLDLLDFSSNDYLGLSRHPRVVAAAVAALTEYGAGAGAARLMSGNLPLHQRLEELLAGWKRTEAALLFGSGYLANIGIIPALVGCHDVIFSDRLNHASIYDGCRLAGARLLRFRHNDPNHLEELLRRERGLGEALIVVESIYSMDGDRAPLAELVALKERFGCRLLVDEAHATGLFGAEGSGVVEEDGLNGRIDLVMGTLGKALGAYGAYVAADRVMIDFLLNRARSFIYATALPPATVAAAAAAVELIRAEPVTDHGGHEVSGHRVSQIAASGTAMRTPVREPARSPQDAAPCDRLPEPGLRRELWAKVDFFKTRLRAAGIGGDLGPSQIIPLRVGESGPTLALAARLQAEGIYAAAVRPPTVPRGSARLRLSVCRYLSEDDLARAATIIGAALAKKT